MLRRWDWFSRSKFSFSFEIRFTVFICESPTVQLSFTELRRRRAAPLMKSIIWSTFTEFTLQNPPLPSRSGCSSDYVQPTVQTLPLKVLTLHFYLFHRNLKTLVHKVFCSGKISPYILQLCEHVQSNSFKKKKKVYFTYSLNVPHLSITPKLTK